MFSPINTLWVLNTKFLFTGEDPSFFGKKSFFSRMFNSLISILILIIELQKPISLPQRKDKPHIGSYLFLRKMIESTTEIWIFNLKISIKRFPDSNPNRQPKFFYR
jgi:hypothetical protein